MCRDYMIYFLGIEILEMKEIKFLMNLLNLLLAV